MSRVINISHSKSTRRDILITRHNADEIPSSIKMHVSSLIITTEKNEWARWERTKTNEAQKIRIYQKIQTKLLNPLQIMRHPKKQRTKWLNRGPKQRKTWGYTNCNIFSKIVKMIFFFSNFIWIAVSIFRRVEFLLISAKSAKSTSRWWNLKYCFA